MNRVKLFIHFAGGLLLAAALTRFLLGLGHEPFLSLPDPLLGIPLRYASSWLAAWNWWWP